MLGKAPNRARSFISKSFVFPAHLVTDGIGFLTNASGDLTKQGAVLCPCTVFTIAYISVSGKPQEQITVVVPHSELGL